MASGSFNLTRTGSTSSYINFLVNWNSYSNGSVANSSTLSVAVYVTKSSGSTSNTWGTVNTSVSVTDAGTQYENGLALNVAPNGSQLVFAKSFIVPHNSDGEKSTTISVNVGGDVVWGNGSANINLDTIPRQATLLTAPNFNDEENPQITFKNPGNFTIDAYIEASGMETIIHNNIPNIGTYTFELTQEEKKQLYLLTKNSNKLNVTFGIQTTIGSDRYWSFLYRTMTIINGNPIFDDFEFKDINEKTINLTGNNQNVILGYSNVEVTIPIINKAIAQKEAVITKYRFNNNETSYSDSEDVNIISNNVTNGEFTVYAIDSRSNSTAKIKSASSVINYNSLTKGNINAKRQNGVSENVLLELDGKIDLVDFGSVTNSIKTARYRYKVASESEWSEFNNLTINVNENGNFAFNGLIRGDTETLGFDIQNAYNIEVYIQDELSEIKYTANFGAGIPHVAYAKNGVGIMGAYDESVGGLLQVGGKRIDDTYSTEEQVIGTWIDLNPIYRKVLNVGALSGANMKTIATPSGIDTLIKCEGMLYDGDGHGYPLNYNNVWNLQQDIGSFYYKDNGISIKAYADFGITKGHIIIEYTKTTD